MAIITITEEGIVTFHGVNDQNALILAQFARNLHENLLAQMQAKLQEMPTANGQQPAPVRATEAQPQERWVPAGAPTGMD